jgi:hypothetical protein
MRNWFYWGRQIQYLRRLNLSHEQNLDAALVIQYLPATYINALEDQSANLREIFCFHSPLG